jgi:glycerophosphoryl diester phosphodiesterase
MQAGFDRLEVDLRYRRGRLLLSHDVPLGPWALGRSGAEFSNTPYLLMHWDAPFVLLPTLLESNVPPLFIDLKGRWSDGALADLMRLLGSARRNEDIVGSKKWGLLDRCRAVAPERPLVYAVGTNELPRLMKQVNGGDVPYGVSVDASMLEGPDHLVARLRDAKLAVYAWNLQRQDELSVLNDAGVAGAIFDEAAWNS